MKKVILIMMILMTLLVSCKKGEKCLVGGKWYHVKTVFNGATVQENSGTYLIFYNDKVEIYDANGTLSSANYVVITDEKISELQYQCKGKKLKIQYGLFNQQDVVFSDFDKNYEEYKR
jgi:uncharacterized protein YxeA